MKNDKLPDGPDRLLVYVFSVFKYKYFNLGIIDCSIFSISFVLGKIKSNWNRDSVGCFVFTVSSSRKLCVINSKEWWKVEGEGWMK